MYIDSHIHLTHSAFEDDFPCFLNTESGGTSCLNRDELIEKIKESGIGAVIEPGIDEDSNRKILKVAYKYDGFLYPAVGIHPTRTYQTKWTVRRDIEELSKNDKVVAIGELGLDYHYERKDQHRIRQILWFLWQIRLADRRRLPLILHIRQADKDAIRILRLNRKKVHGGVCHCFNQGPDIAKIYTEELGLMLGIGGSLLQGNHALEQAVKVTPLSYLILETDGPYVKPVKPEGISGKEWKKTRNTSLIIPKIAGRVAKIRGIDVKEVERVTTENAQRLFNI